MKEQNYQSELELLKECCEKALGSPFDQMFEQYLDDINAVIMWSTSIMFYDRQKQMTLEQLQSFAHLGQLHFNTQSDFEEDGELCELYEGDQFKTPQTYGVYSITDEEDVAYIGDDVYNIQCLINNVVSKALKYNYDIRHFSIAKSIEGQQYIIFLDYFEGIWSINYHVGCENIAQLLISVFESHGLFIFNKEIDDDLVFIQFKGENHE